MTLAQQIVTIGICALATMLTRFLPFAVFSEKRKTPPYIEYLGGALPGAIFAMLVVYCLRNLTLFSGDHGLPELLAVGCTVLIHLWKRNTLLSIALGTAAYMILIRLI